MHRKSKRRINKWRLDKPFESNLRALWREFKRCSEMYSPLYCEQLTFGRFSEMPLDDLSKPLRDESWLAFIAAHQPNKDANEWWVWERLPFFPGIQRYSGCLDGLAEFKLLAESAAILFEEMDLIPFAESFHRWVWLLLDVGLAQQMPLLRAKAYPCGYRTFELGDLQSFAERWHSPQEGVRDYPFHSHTIFLVHSVFTSSMSLIESVLDPETVVFTSLARLPNMNELLGPTEVVPDEATSIISSELSINLPPDKNVFRKISAKSWVIQFVEGCTEPERGVVDGVEGFYLIQKVLSSEKQPVSPIDLYAAIPEKGIELSEADDKLRRAKKDADDEGMPRRRSGSGMGVFDMADAEAITNYRNRRKELLAFIEQVTPNEASKELDDAKRELEFINKELNSVTNLDGKARLFPLGTPEEAARIRVKTSWSRALKLLRESKKFEKLSEFLNLYLKTQGAQGRQYMKAGEVKWET